MFETHPLPESCKQPPGKLTPIVDPTKCEAKTPCDAACPVDVVTVERIAPDVFRRLPPMAKLKVWVHGMKTATTPNADAVLAARSAWPHARKRRSGWSR